ncbi:MAG: hypothetical protein SFT92_10090 [Rickettsiales bacterium]|nr:hypothetical protein [Rickettsiales bacterium]
MEQPAHLPPQYATATEALKKVIAGQPITTDEKGTQQLIEDPAVVVSKGFNNPLNGKPGEDVLQITVDNPLLTNSYAADSVSNALSHALNSIAALRDAAVLVSPREYKTNVGTTVGELVKAAKDAGIPGSNVDYSKAVLFNPEFSDNQMQKYATEVIDSPAKTLIRVNIPTNPNDRDGSAALAKRVEDDLNRRLPEIKTQMIERIKAKGYIKNITPEIEKQLQGHEIKVSSQQQANWTSVFLEIRSPEQLAVRNDPSKISDADNEKLKHTNMLMQITDEQSRSKLAARAIMFEGEKLAQPASFFLDVAGTKDIENGLGKLMFYLSKMKPELAGRAKALMDENLFKDPNQWNLPPDKTATFKHGVHISINPDHPTQMKVQLCVPKGKADEIATAISSLKAGPALANPFAPAAAPAVAAPVPVAEATVPQGLPEGLTAALAGALQPEAAVAGAAVTPDVALAAAATQAPQGDVAALALQTAQGDKLACAAAGEDAVCVGNKVKPGDPNQKVLLEAIRAQLAAQEAAKNPGLGLG